MRFFRNAAGKTSKWASREYTSHAFSLMWSVFRQRPKRRLRGGDVRAKKDLKDDVRCSWNETFYYRYKEKIQWRSGIVLVTLDFFPEKQLRYNILSLSVGLIVEWEKKTNKQTSWWYTFRLLNFICHQLLIMYNSNILTWYYNFCPSFSTSRTNSK